MSGTGEATGQERARKAGRVVCTIYTVLLVPLLSFYMPEGYRSLGNHKFEAYRLLSGIFYAVLLLIFLYERAAGFSERRAGSAQGADRPERQRRILRLPDLAAVCYAVFLTASYLFSADRGESLWGTAGWRMGYLTELFLLLGYFFVRVYPPVIRAAAPAAMLSAGGVIALALADRMGFRFLRIFGQDPSFLSTIGNVDWYCGYLAAALSVAAAVSLRETGIKRLTGVVLLLAGTASALTQGARTGLLLLAVLFPAMLACTARPGSLWKLFRILSAVWTALLLIFLTVLPFCRRLPGDPFGNLLTDGFGNGRGAAWRMFLELYASLPPLRKLFGVGPDGFAAYAYADPYLSRRIIAWFGGARLVNAHQELLTLLAEEGAFAACAWLLFLLAVLIVLCRRPDGACSALTLSALFGILTLYAVQALTFRTVSATPFLYILMGAAVGEDFSGRKGETQ